MKEQTYEEKIKLCNMKLRANEGDDVAIIYLRREITHGFLPRVFLYIAIILVITFPLWLISKKGGFINLLKINTSFLAPVFIARELASYVFPILADDEYVIYCPIVHMVGYAVLVFGFKCGKLEGAIICVLIFVLVTNSYIKDTKSTRETNLKAQLYQIELDKDKKIPQTKVSQCNQQNIKPNLPTQEKTLLNSSSLDYYNAEFKRRFGMHKHPYTGQPITSVQEYLDAMESLEKQQNIVTQGKLSLQELNDIFWAKFGSYNVHSVYEYLKDMDEWNHSK